MGDDAQSPALEISIWVMAHKHLPDCVQPPTQMSSKVVKVIRFIQVPLSCLYTFHCPSSVQMKSKCKSTAIKV